MKQNERVLSSQALNVGRSLGQSLGIRTWRNLLSTQLFGDTTSIKLFGNPSIGEKLQVDQEPGNKADKFAVKVVKNNKFAMKVVKNNEIIGNLPREYSQNLWYFIARGEQDSPINTRRHKRLLSEPTHEKVRN